jgi:cytochrome c
MKRTWWRLLLTRPRWRLSAAALVFAASGAIAAEAPLLTRAVNARDSNDAGLPPAGDPVAGLKVARTQCATCHVVVVSAKGVKKRVSGAPPDFLAIAQNPKNDAETLREILRFPHGRMSNVLLTRKDTANVISYIASLK